VFDRLARRLGKLPLVVRVAPVLVALALPGVAGWFIADWLGGYRVVGAVVPYLLLWFLSDERTFHLVVSTVVAFVALLPVIYGLIVIVQVLLLAFGLAPYAGIGDFFLRNLDGVLGATALAAGLTLLGAMKKAAEASRSTRPNLDDIFLTGLSYRIPLAFVLAGLMDVPEAPSALLLLGVAWGIVAATSGMIYTAVVDEEPIKDAWLYVVLTEMVLVVGGLISALNGLTDDRKILDQVLPLVAAAAVACAGSYLLACLVAALVGRAVRINHSRRTAKRDGRAADDPDPAKPRTAHVSDAST
jgi:hypothetical protein